MKCEEYLLTICSFTLICLAECAPPSFLKGICKSNDAKCLKETTKAAIPIFAKGLPEFNVPSLDPMSIKFINASEGNLIFLLKDVTAVGLENCEAKKVERDAAKSKMHLQFLCTGKLDGQYELKGSLLFVPIEGKGAIHAHLRSCIVNIDMDIVDKDGDDGKKHWHIKSWSHSFDLKDKSDVVFENLYNGNEVLGRAARELVKSNGNDIVKEIGPPVVKALMAKVVKACNNFFKVAAIEDLSID